MQQRTYHGHILWILGYDTKCRCWPEQRWPSLSDHLFSDSLGLETYHRNRTIIYMCN